MKNYMAFGRFFGRYEGNLEAQPKRDNRVLDEDTSGKAKFTVSTTGISRVMLENIKKRLTAIGGTYSETLT